MKLCPFEAEQRKKLAYQTRLTALLTAAAAVMVVLLWNLLIEKHLSLYALISAVFLTYIIHCEIPRICLERMERRLSWSMLQYFSQVKQKYLFGKNIPNAVYDAAREQCYEIRLHAMELHELLTGTNRKNRVRNYVCSSFRNKYWKMFLVQAYETSEKGDSKTTTSESLFAENMEHLRLELMLEIHRNRQKEHDFSGCIFVTLTPVFTMSVLKTWGISFAPDLTGYYDTAGQWVCLLCFVITAMLYTYIKKLKKTGGQVSEAGHEIKQFQTILWMERRFSGMTIAGLLEDLESFAVQFQPVIRECINSYMAGPQKALRKLREEGGKQHPAFAEIAEEFLAVDEVGIEMAFAGVENNRKMLEQMEQLEADIKMEQRKDGMELIVRIPAILVVGLYFIIPFLYSALSGVKEVFSVIESLR